MTPCEVIVLDGGVPGLTCPVLPRPRQVHDPL